MTTLVSLKEAAILLDKSPQLLRRLVWDGTLQAMRGSQNTLLFEIRVLNQLNETQYPAGMSHTDIAVKYGVKRGIVIYHFKRLNVKPKGIGRACGGRAIYDEATVVKFAKILKWREVEVEVEVEVEPGSPTDESLAHDRAISSAD